MTYGFIGRILRVDLSHGSISTDEHSVDFYRRYMGGRGLIAYYLLNEVPQGLDPFHPDNRLVFAPGVVTGAPVAGSGRNSVGAKSPLTGGFGEAEAGGFFGAELKHAGFDGIVVHGRADKPVYLWVHDGQAELRDATQLWGLDTGEAQDHMRQELADQRVRTA
jgi:aldehyde:ferredoxin oxidoreductase